MRGVRRFEHVKCLHIRTANLLQCTNSRSNVQRCNMPTTPVKIVSKFVVNAGETLSQTHKKILNKKFS